MESKMFPTPRETGELFSQYSSLPYVDTGDLTLLDEARRTRSSIVEDLPSWALDLSKPGKMNVEDGHRWDLYSASGKIVCNVATNWLDLHKPMLSAKVIYVSSIQACAERASPSLNHTENLRELINNWFVLWNEFAKPPKINAFRRACFMDSNVQVHWLTRRKGPLRAERLDEIKT